MCPNQKKRELASILLHEMYSQFNLIKLGYRKKMNGKYPQFGANQNGYSDKQIGLKK